MKLYPHPSLPGSSAQRAALGLLCIFFAAGSSLAAQQDNSRAASLIVQGLEGPPWPATVEVELTEGGSTGLLVELRGAPRQSFVLLHAPAGALRRGQHTQLGFLDLDPRAGMTVLCSGFTDDGGRASLPVVVGSTLIGSRIAIQALVGDPTSPSSLALTGAFSVAVTPTMGAARARALQPRVIRDNLAGASGMIGAFASQATGIWGMPGTVITSPSNGTINSYRVMVYGDVGGMDPDQTLWGYLDFRVHFWNSVAAYFASPQNGDVQAFFLSPSNSDWFTPRGSYAGRTQYHFQFSLSTSGMAVTNGQEFVIAVEGIESFLSARMYHSFSTTPPAAGSDVYASHVFAPDYFSNLGAPTNWVGSKVVIR